MKKFYLPALLLISLCSTSCREVFNSSFGFCETCMIHDFDDTVLWCEESCGDSADKDSLAARCWDEAGFIYTCECMDSDDVPDGGD